MTAVLVILLVIDALSNIFLLIYSPRWEDTKRQYIGQLEEQNKELREFIKAMQ